MEPGGGGRGEGYDKTLEALIFYGWSCVLLCLLFVPYEYLLCVLC